MSLCYLNKIDPYVIFKCSFTLTFVFHQRQIHNILVNYSVWGIFLPVVTDAIINISVEKDLCMLYNFS